MIELLKVSMSVICLIMLVLLFIGSIISLGQNVPPATIEDEDEMGIGGNI